MLFSLRLYQELNPTERRVLIEEKKSVGRQEKAWDGNLTFQPYISDRSKAMAQNKRPS